MKKYLLILGALFCSNSLLSVQTGETTSECTRRIQEEYKKALKEEEEADKKFKKEMKDSEGICGIGCLGM